MTHQKMPNWLRHL